MGNITEMFAPSRGFWAVADLGIPKRGCGTSVLGTEVPQRGPGAEPRWVSGSDAPRSYGHYATFTTYNKRKLNFNTKTQSGPAKVRPT